MSKSKIIVLLVYVPFMLIGKIFAQTNAPTANKIVGLYWSPKKDAKINIYKKGTLYYGKSVWVAHPRKDTNNPDKSLQPREVLGIELLSGFAYDDRIYSNGTIYDPESGNTYKCKITSEGNNLKVRGYIGISLFGRTEIFERINTK